jgi:hypothetical protein
MEEGVLGSYGRAYKILVGHNEGNRPLGRPKSRWGDNIETDLKRDKARACGLYSLGSG